MRTLQETKNKIVDLGVEKTQKTTKQKFILGFIAGAMIAFAYWAFIKTMNIKNDLILAASLFPIGLIIILLAGGELATGNMMVVGTAYMNEKVSLKDYLSNVFQITVFNLLGVFFVFLVTFVLDEWFDGSSLTNLGQSLVSITLSKTSASSMQVFVSAMMCNWFVGLSVWLCNAFDEGAAKFIAIWFPIMIFVVLGFQHSIANSFLLLSTYFSSSALLISDVFNNFVFSFLGNLIGGLFFVSALYTWASND